MYRALNTLRLGYTNQSVSAVQGNNSCFFTYSGIYTECPRRNVPDFGRVFLMLKYTDITQNTCNQS